MHWVPHAAVHFKQQDNFLAQKTKDTCGAQTSIKTNIDGMEQIRN